VSAVDFDQSEKDNSLRFRACGVFTQPRPEADITPIDRPVGRQSPAHRLKLGRSVIDADSFDGKGVELLAKVGDGVKG
jgi:hypothetical protein